MTVWQNSRAAKEPALVLIYFLSFRMELMFVSITFDSKPGPGARARDLIHRAGLPEGTKGPCCCVVHCTHHNHHVLYHILFIFWFMARTAPSPLHLCEQGEQLLIEVFLV